mgnify:CR=1 FL=1
MSPQLLVGNVPVEATEEDLKEYFNSFGSVRSVTIAKNEKGKGKGFAFVEMNSRKEAVQAHAALASCEFLGRRLSISLKDPVNTKPTGIFAWFKLFKPEP